MGVPYNRQYAARKFGCFPVINDHVYRFADFGCQRPNFLTSSFKFAQTQRIADFKQQYTAFFVPRNSSRHLPTLLTIRTLIIGLLNNSRQSESAKDRSEKAAVRQRQPDRPRKHGQERREEIAFVARQSCCAYRGKRDAQNLFIDAVRDKLLLKSQLRSALYPDIL